jgi:hypothetical protein
MVLSEGENVMARQNKVTDDGYPIVHGRLTTTYGFIQRTVWTFKFKQHDYTDCVVLELDDGTRSKPFCVGSRKSLTIPCKRMGRILPGVNSHLFDV